MISASLSNEWMWFKYTVCVLGRSRSQNISQIMNLLLFLAYLTIKANDIYPDNTKHYKTMLLFFFHIYR